MKFLPAVLEFIYAYVLMVEKSAVIRYAVRMEPERATVKPKRHATFFVHFQLLCLITAKSLVLCNFLQPSDTSPFFAFVFSKPSVYLFLEGTHGGDPVGRLSACKQTCTWQQTSVCPSIVVPSYWPCLSTRISGRFSNLTSIYEGRTESHEQQFFVK